MTTTAIVTGATGGIGRAMTRKFCANGIRVVAVGSRAAPLDELCCEFGCDGLTVNVGDHHEVARAFATVEADVLVHCAGLLGEQLPIHLTPPDMVSTLLTVNVSGTFNVLRSTVPGMIARRRGTIIFLGSVCGHVPGAGPGLYSATKAAMQSIASNLRFDLQETPIRVSEIRLGRVETGIHEQLHTGGEFYEGYDCIKPDDVAETVLHIIAGPSSVDLSIVEMMPNRQVVGGTKFAKSGPRPLPI